MTCYHCGQSGGHHEACPDTRGVKADAIRVWLLGYQDGRAGRAKALPDDPTYILGYTRGECAAEEAENGFDPVREGHQW